MQDNEQLKYHNEEGPRELQHDEYFRQFNDVILHRFSLNEDITLYRTNQSFPCSEDDKQARMFRKKNGIDPVIPIYSQEELETLDEEAKYQLVTKGALSFNTSPDAAKASAKQHDKKLRKEKGGKNKSATYRKSRGTLIGKYDFPAELVLRSECKNEHVNILTYKSVDIEDYRDKSFKDTVDYEDDGNI